MRKAYKRNTYASTHDRLPSFNDDLSAKANSASQIQSPQHIYSVATPDAELKDYIAGLSKQEVNQTDLFGRTLLHIAASTGQYQLVEALLEHPGIDPSIQDLENGWTPLHRACYNGYIMCAIMLIANNYDCLFIKDRCRQRPFDLLPINLSPLDLAVTNHWNPNIGGSHLLKFGLNTNHILGFADPDNRAFPQVVELRRDTFVYSTELMKKRNSDINNAESSSTDESDDDEELATGFPLKETSPRLKFQNVRIKDVQISKFHSAVITTDPTNNLLICGLATGGRLGLDSDITTTQYTYKAVPRFNTTKVLSVSLGLDHTLALTSQSVYSWGSNQYGQLGTNSEDLSPQLMPRKINSDFGLEEVKGIAASQYHSVAFTDKSIYFWGKNIGQMGSLPGQDLWQSSKKNLVCEDGGIIVPYPQIFPHLPSPVKMLTACDIATVCLLQNSSVWVFMNGGHFRVLFPFNTLSPKDFELYRTPETGINRRIFHISCSEKGAVCAIDDHGTVYSFLLAKHYIEPSQLDESVKASHIAKVLKVNTVWTPRGVNDAACDADIGDDGQVILCTLQGTVWKRIQRSKAYATSTPTQQMDITTSDGKKKYHYERVPFLNKAYQVRCDRLFSSFAVIRDDDGLKYLTLDETSISNDFANLVSFENPTGLHMQAKYLARFSHRRARHSFNRQKKQHDSHTSLLQADMQFTKGRSLLTTNELVEINSLREFSTNAAKCLCSTTHNSFDTYFDNTPNTRLYDLAVVCSSSETCIPVHRYIMISRIPKLFSLIKGEISEITGLMNFRVTYDPTPSKHFKYGKLTIFDDVHELAIKVLIYYLYTDKYIKPWDDWVPLEGVRKNKPYEDFNRVITALNMDSIRYLQGSSVNNLGVSLLGSLEVAAFKDYLDTDVEILLENGSVNLHSYILQSRSAYFATVLSERWNNKASPVTINLQHIKKDVFDIIINYIYGDEHITSFDNIGEKFSTPKEFVNFVVKVLDTAAELTLLRLFQGCEVILADMITMKNVGILLEHSIEFSAQQLELTCLEFIRLNLEVMIEKGYLSNISTDTFIVIDEYVRKVIHKSFIFHDDPGKNNTLAYDFINDLDSFNENLTSLVPYMKQDVSDNAIETAFSEKSTTRRRSSAKHSTPLSASFQPTQNSIVYSEVFEMDGEASHNESPANPGRTSSMSSEKINSGWHVVSGRKTSFTNSSKPVMPSTSPQVNSPKADSLPASAPRTSPVLMNESTFPKIGQWGSNSTRKMSNSTSFERRPSIIAADKAIPKASGLTNALDKAKVSNTSINGSSNSSTFPQPQSADVFQGETLSSLIDTTGKKGGKLSQRERRKMQLDLEKQGREQPQVVPDSSGGNNPWNVTAAPAVKNVDLDSPFSMYSKSATKKSDAEIAASYKPTITEIMQEEQFEIKQKAIEKSKSLKEIQEEEQFAKWWAEESAKVQREQEFLESLGNPGSSSSGDRKRNQQQPQQPQKKSSKGANNGSKRRSQKKQGPSTDRDLVFNSGIPLPSAGYKSNGQYHYTTTNNTNNGSGNNNGNNTGPSNGNSSGAGGSGGGNGNHKRRGGQSSASRGGWKGKGRTTIQQT